MLAALISDRGCFFKSGNNTAYLCGLDKQGEEVIGAAKMQKWRLRLDSENNTVTVDPRAAKLILINLIRKD